MYAARRPRTASDGPPAAAPGGSSRAAAPPAETPRADEPATDGAAGARPARSARIVAARGAERDSRLLERERLLARVVRGEGRGAITRAADEYWRAGFTFPDDQNVQLQLLEHLDEARAREAIASLAGLLEREPPLKRPVLEQRLKRLEDGADEPATRSAASELRRALRG